MNNLFQEDTICALATGEGLSAIAIIRLSGKDAIKITNSYFSKDISTVKTHTIHFGTISEDNRLLMKYWLVFLKIQNLIQEKRQ